MTANRHISESGARGGDPQPIASPIEGLDEPIAAAADPASPANAAAGAPGDDATALRARNVARVRMLWEHRRPLARWVAWGFAAALALAFVIPSRYQSGTRLMPPDASSSNALTMLAAMGDGAGGGLGNGAGSLAGDLLGIKSSGDLMVGILRGPSVEDALIAKFDLRRLYRDRHEEAARKDLERTSDIDVDRKSGIITIAVTDRDPRRAAAMAREYVEQLNRLLTEVNTSSAHREREFLEQRLAEVRGDLKSAEERFSSFSSKNNALDIPEQSKAMIEAGATLEGQLIAARTELGALRQTYTDNNVRVRALEAKVTELDRQAQKLSGKFDGAGNAGDSGDPSMYVSTRQLPLLGVDYADLYRNTKVEEGIFEALTREYELAKVEEAKETPTLKVIDPARVPETRSYPPRVLLVALGTLGSFLLGLAWVFGTRRWRQMDPDDPGKVLATEIFAGTVAPLGAAWLGAARSGREASARWARVRASRLAHRAAQGQVTPGGPR